MPQQLLDTLPTDTLDTVSCYLTGWDLFQLSHVNSQCWHRFSRSMNWDRHLSSQNQQSMNSNAKRKYAQSRSFLFQGLQLDERLSHCGGINGSGGAVVKNMLPFTETFKDVSSFTIDMWFSLLDGEVNGVLTGGVLLGGQSPLMRTCLWTNYHVAFIAVDGDRNLFCSILDDTTNNCVAKLDFGRWYHLALSYDQRVQRVYLNGELVSELGGLLSHSWHHLSQVQVGTGFVSSFWRQKTSFHFDTRNRGVRTFCGWHNFHEVVDEFRVWRKLFNEEEIQSLAQCQDLSETPWYSLQNAASASKVKRVPCTRPHERIVVLQTPFRCQWKLGATLVECWHNVHGYLTWLPFAVTTK